MFPKLSLKIMFLKSRIGVLYATGQCYEGNALLVECSPEETLLRRIGSACLKSAISGVRKKSRVRASISVLVKTSVNRTIVQRKQDRKISIRIRGDFTCNVLETEVHLNLPICTSVWYSDRTSASQAIALEQQGKNFQPLWGSFLFTIVSGNKTQARLTTRVLKS